jgi:hypothetical protein
MNCLTFQTHRVNIKLWNLNYSSRRIHGYDCYIPEAFHISEWLLNLIFVKYPTLLITAIQRIFSICSYIPVNLHLFRCKNGLQMSFHRLQDGNFDCYPLNDDEVFENEIDICNKPDRFDCYLTIN